MQAMQQFCLRWNNHQPNFISVFTTLLNDEALVDVTLACEGKHLQAHRVVLSACSAYFQTLFTINPCQHPIVILKDIKFSDLKTMVDFMYYGEVNVSQEQLPAILKIAEMLKIKGLADIPDMRKQASSIDKDLLTPGDPAWARSSSPMSPAMRRKRLRKSSTGSGSGSTEQTSEELMGESISGHSPSVKVEHVDVDEARSYSRQSLRNSHQEPSTDSEPKEGSQDSGAEEYISRHDRQPSRQQSNESRQLSYENRQMSAESRQGSYEMRQLSHDSRQSSFDGRQSSHETRHISMDSRQASHESRQLSFEGRQLSHEDGRQGSHDSKQMSHESKQMSHESRQMSHESRQMSHESRLSHESSIESVTADLEATSSNLSPSVTHVKVGTKRGRLLMRQQRIKKENDMHTSPDSDPGSPSYPSLLPVSSAKIERQRSEPTPASYPSPPPPTHTSNLLTVPQPTFTVRQHSTQSPPPFAVGTLLVRQISQPPSLGSVQVKSVQTSDDCARSASPSIVMEPLPIVRIIAEASDPAKKNSYPSRSRSEEVKRTSVPSASLSEPVPETCRSGHCPVLRTGPALGCNYCWNTIDAHGRILRRKTKYHCPECQTNLCIVPCFQDYHRRHVELPNKPEQPSVS